MKSSQYAVTRSSVIKHIYTVLSFIIFFCTTPAVVAANVDLAVVKPSAVPSGVFSGQGKSLSTEESSTMSLMSSETIIPRYLLGIGASAQISEVDSSSGAFSHEIPIQIPPGRNGVQPTLKLSYSSYNGSQGDLFGYGWDVQIPYIRRINKTGAEDLFSDDHFYSSLSGELTRVGTSTSFVSKVDTGAYLNYEFSNQTWTVRDNDGNTYVFGASSSTRQDNPADGNQIFKWMLTETRDPNDNYVEYSYYKEAGAIYPATIVYTGHSSSSGPFSVEFIREARNDIATSSSPGFLTSTKQIISEIRTKIDSTLVRKYVLDYGTGDNTERSLLTSVTETGYDENGNPITLPPIQLTYQLSPQGWQSTSDFSLPEDTASNVDIGTRFADVNGDGLTDLLRGQGGTKKVYINESTGWTYASAWQLPEAFVDGDGIDLGTRILDLNGDNLPDIARSSVIDSVSYKKVYLNTGTGWQEDSQWTLPLDFRVDYGDTGVRFGDANGDGLTDLWWEQNYPQYPGGAFDENAIYLNDGYGNWSLSSQTVPGRILEVWNLDGELVTDDEFSEVVDVNGDGLADFLNLGADNADRAYINTGSGWVNDPAWYSPVQLDYGTRFADLNGDGLVDILTQYSSSTAFINTGSGWIEDNDWAQPIDFTDGTQLTDLDGDGLPDMVRKRDTDHQRFFNEGRHADLLVNVINEKGGATSVSYQSTGKLRDQSDDLLNPALPFVLQVADKVGENDGLGNQATTTFRYSDGEYYFDGAENRKFSGFGLSEKTDPLGNVTKTYFHQGNSTNATLGEYEDHISKVGKPYRIETYDDDANLYSKTIQKWDIVNNDNDTSVPWYDQNWAYRLQLSIDSDQVAGNLTNFPVYLDLSDLPTHFHTNVKSNACDIRVVEDDNLTETPFEVVNYDSATDTGELHFLADSLSGSVDKTFYVYYGNAGASCYSATDTYGRNAVWNGYRAVYHLQTSGGVDATGHGYTLTESNATYTPALLGDGINLGNNSDIRRLSLNSSLGIGATDAFTTAFIWKQNTDDTTGTPIPFRFVSSTGGDYKGYQMQYESNPRVRIFAENSLLVNGSLGTGVNHFKVTRASGAGGLYSYYKNDAIQGTTTQGANSFNSTGEISIGANSAGNAANGWMDEVRVTNVVQSVNWGSTEYNNYNSPNTFYSIGSPEAEASFQFSDGTDSVQLTQAVDFSYDGDSDHKEKAVSYSYSPAHGKLVEKTEWGEVQGNNDGTFSDTGSDKYVTNISYATSTGATSTKFYLPSQEITTDQSSNKVSEQKIYYDSLTLGSIDKGNSTKVEQWVADTTYIDVEKTYNSYGLVTTENDPRDKVTQYSYDPYNLYPATTTNPLSHTVARTYDYSSGQTKKIIDPNGFVSETLYDGLDRVREEKQPDLSSPSTLVTKSAYFYTNTTLPSTRVVNYLDGTVSTDSYLYHDGLGRVVQERKQAEDEGAYIAKDTKYDWLGRKDRESLPYFSNNASSTSATTTNNLYLKYKYDPLGRVQEVNNVLGTSSTAYDQWVETTTDVLGKVKKYGRDAYGRLVTTIEQSGSSSYTTAYDWTYGGNLAKLTDAEGNIRNFAYDALGRRLSAEDLHGTSDSSFGEWEYDYDNSGNLTSVTDPKNQTISYTYDDLNRVLTEDFTSNLGTEVSYTYDNCANGLSHLCSATSSASATSYAYNSLGLTSSETKLIGVDNYTSAYQYNRQGNISLLVYPDNSEVRYIYNSGGLLESVEQRESGGTFTAVVSDFDYGPHGQVIYRLNGNGTETTRTYDANELYRLRSIYTATSTSFGLLSGGGEQSEMAPLLSVMPDDKLLALDVDIASSTDEFVSEESGDDEPIVGEDLDAATSTQMLDLVDDTATSSDSGIEIIDLILVGTTTPATSTVDVATTTETEREQERPSASDRARSKSEEIVRQDFGNNEYVVSTGKKGSPLRLEIQSLRTVQDGSSYGVELYARAWRDSGQLGFGRDGSVEWERFLVWNPPVMVADESGDHAQQWVDEETGEKHVKKFRRDAKQALLESLAHTINVIGQEGTSIESGKHGNTTSVFYPDAHPETSTHDGWTVYGSATDKSWSTLRSGSANQAGDSDSVQSIASLKTGGSQNTWWDLFRGHFLFNTAPLPDNNVILTATLSLYGADSKNDNLSPTNVELHVVSAPAASTTAISLSDHSTMGTSSLGRLLPSEGFVTGVYNNINFNDTGKSSIVPTGLTALGTRLNVDRLNLSPEWVSGNSYDGYYANYADDIGTTHDPKLIVEHYGGSSGYDGGIQNLSYTYDAVGNLTKIVSNAPSEEAAVTVTYQYDDLYRLLSASTTYAGTLPYSHTYSYNSLGNLTSSNLGSYSYTQTGYANPHAATSIGGTSLSYDNNGNLTAYGSNDYVWDYRNRLIEADTGPVTTYGYDHSPQRVSKTTNGITTVYPNQYFEKANATTTKYIWAGGELIATVEGTGTTTVNYIHTDHLGSTNVVTDENANVVQVLDYYPYGSLRVDETTSSDASKKFTGHDFDRESDLTYAGARYYHQDIARWVSTDPASRDNPNQFLRDPQQFNGYSYARNNPLILIDPDGEKVELVAKPIFGVGNHLFYRVTPDSPESISINGLPTGTTEFTLGAYNPDHNNPLNNRLVKGIGCDGCDSKSTDFGVQGRGSVTINAPNNMSDTDFINSLGSAYNNASDGQNYVLTGPGGNGYSNSNNFVYDIGSQVGVGNQVSSFNPTGWTPGNNRSLASPNQPSRYQQTLSSIQQTLSRISDILKKKEKN